MKRRLTEEIAQTDPCTRPQPVFVPVSVSISETETEFYAGAGKLDFKPNVDGEIFIIIRIIL